MDSAVDRGGLGPIVWLVVAALVVGTATSCGLGDDRHPLERRGAEVVATIEVPSEWVEIDHPYEASLRLFRVAELPDPLVLGLPDGFTETPTESRTTVGPYYRVSYTNPLAEYSGSLSNIPGTCHITVGSTRDGADLLLLIAASCEDT